MLHYNYVRMLLISTVLMTSLLAACQPVTRQGHDEMAAVHSEEQAGEHAEGHTAHWGYEGEGGPDQWGELNPDYTVCADGSAQSPIDLRDAAGEDLADIVFEYGDSPLKILNNGHTVQANYDEGSYIVMDGVQYDLVQFHVHGASEHTVAGEHYPLEFHFVHQFVDEDKKAHLAVVGVLVVEGEENTAFADVVANAPTEVSQEMMIDNVVIAAESMLPSERLYFAYSGSLTTPPCSESVKWHVLTTPIEMSAEQIESLASIVHNNFRPVQPLNDRDLKVDTTSN